jgi:hypothetical protein
MAAGLSVDLEDWRREFDELMLRVGGRFARVEPRGRMTAFVRGLLAGLARVNCGSIAEHAGEQCPRGMQRLLSAAAWDDAGMRDDLRAYVLEHFADPRFSAWSGLATPTRRSAPPCTSPWPPRKPTSDACSPNSTPVTAPN